MIFELHNQTSAPEESKSMLEDSLKAFGMVPNLHAVMAESPNVLESYKFLHEMFQSSSFNAEELTVVWQTINVEHDCHYCVPAHTGIAHMMKVDPKVTESLRNASELPNARLQALHELTLDIVRSRGLASKDKINTFFDEGFQKAQLLEIILGISQKVMSNYINHLSDTPVDKAFSDFAWKKS
jgi:alkylhydroperoxidase family enzyme